MIARRLGLLGVDLGAREVGTPAPPDIRLAINNLSISMSLHGTGVNSAGSGRVQLVDCGAPNVYFST
jgi:hypothetical protein